MSDILPFVPRSQRAPVTALDLISWEVHESTQEDIKTVQALLWDIRDYCEAQKDIGNETTWIKRLSEIEAVIKSIDDNPMNIKDVPQMAWLEEVIKNMANEWALSSLDTQIWDVTSKVLSDQWILTNKQ